MDIGGKPAIAFYNLTDDGLRYAWLSNSDPATPGDWTVTDVDALGGKNASLAVIDGKPAIAHDNGTNVRYVGATDAAGSAWGSAIIVETGVQSPLADIGGLPMISYQGSGNLKLAISADAAGARWPVGNLVTADGGAVSVGSHSSLAVVAGLPAIAYYVMRAPWTLSLRHCQWRPGAPVLERRNPS